MPSTTDDTRHFFLPMQRESHEQTNRRVGTAFCEAFQRQFDRAARLLTVGGQTGSPDAVIEVAGKQVVLELAGYRQRDEYHELEVRESEVKSALADSLQQSGVPPFDIYIGWREEPRQNLAKSISRDRTRVPDKAAQPDFLAEFVRSVRVVAKNPQLNGREIVFDNAEVVAEFKRNSPDTPMLDRREYPTLAHYCTSIRLDSLSHPRRPLIHSPFDARWVGPDLQETERVLGNKLNKISQYRAAARGKDLWLVIHADGMPPSTWTNEAERGQVFKLICKTAARLSDQFDQVWWAEYTWFQDETKIWASYSPRGPNLMNQGPLLHATEGKLVLEWAARRSAGCTESTELGT